MKSKKWALLTLLVIMVLVATLLVACTVPSAEAELKNVANATINNNEVSMFVEDVDSVSLANVVKTSANSTWILSLDISGQNEVKDKVATLVDGTNVYYIIVTAEDKQHSNTYTLTIYKRFEVTISFYDGADLLAEIKTYSGKQIYIDFEPQLTGGYVFQYWYMDSDPQTSVTSLVPMQDINLYAHKTIKTFKIVLNVNGGEHLPKSQDTED